MLVKFVIFSIFMAVAFSSKVRYDNYVLYKPMPETDDQLEFLKNLYQAPEGLDFWKAPSTVYDFVSVVSPPDLRNDFELSLKNYKIRYEIRSGNIQESFDKQKRRMKRDVRNQMFWTNYQTLDEIYTWFNHLATNYSNMVTVVTAGQSHEGRNITGIRISRGSSSRAFFLVGGQIGADWLSPTVVTYIADQLIRGEDPEARAASEDFEWYIFPVANPDGFEFSQDSVRLWVKNRRPITTTAVGVDLTRNWNAQWGVRGGSFTPANNNYIGLGPFSEVESRVLSRFIETVGPRLTGFLSFSAFGQKLLIPFAHTTTHMYNYDEMVTIGRRAMGSLAIKYNTQYTVDTSGAIHDGSTGNIVDWAKHRFNPPIAASYLLRDDGSWGYILPVSQVEPTCEETFDSILAIIREARFINVI